MLFEYSKIFGVIDQNSAVVEVFFVIFVFYFVIFVMLFEYSKIFGVIDQNSAVVEVFFYILFCYLLCCL